MRIVLDVPDDAFQVKKGAMETYRSQLVTIQRAIRTARGSGKLVVRAYVNIYDRKKPWKFNPKLSMAHRNMVRRAKLAAANAVQVH